MQCCGLAAASVAAPRTAATSPDPRLSGKAATSYITECDDAAVSCHLCAGQYATALGFGLMGSRDAPRQRRRRRCGLVAAAGFAAVAIFAFGASASASSSDPRCLPVDLGIHFAGGEGATAMEISEFEFINVSDHECHLIGYPGAAFYDRAGHVLSVKVGRGSLRDKAPKLVSLKPGGRTGFLTNTSAFAPRKGACVTADFVHFTPPNDESTLSIRHQLLICGKQMQIGPVGQG